MRIDCLDKFDVDKLDDEDTIAEEELDRAILAGEFENIVDDEGEGVIAAEGSQSRLWSFPESQLTD